MKKFSITKLESARANPIAFASTLSDSPTVYGHNPKSVRWLTAATIFYKTRNYNQAVNYLENSFSNRKPTKRNVLEVTQLRQALLASFDEYTQRQYSYHSHRTRIEIELSKKVKITGIIWLINSTLDGKYSSYTIVDGDSINNWKYELRHPIIQNYIATKIHHCSLENVSAGIINYRTGLHESITYSDEDIKQALEELQLIGSKISSVL